MKDTHIWYDMDVSECYNEVYEFFAKWGFGTSSVTEEFSGIKDPESLFNQNGLQASCVEDVPDRIVIAFQDYGGSGRMLVLRPIGG